MRRQKLRGCRGAAVLFIVLAALVAFRGVVMAGAPQPKVARAVYITTTKACACTLKRCQAGDAVVARVFSGARQRLLSRVDMATDKDAATPSLTDAMRHSVEANAA